MHPCPIPKRHLIHRLRFIVVTTLCFVLFAGCVSTGNNFDESKLQQIKKGITTEADLVKTFGQPGSRTVNSENVTTLIWTYAEANVKAESFIPYAGAFMGGTKGQSKSLTVTLVADRVTGYTFSGGGSETRQTTQSVPKN